MPQTKFVLGKALERGLRPIVVLNKVDRPDAEPDGCMNEAFDLFAALGASDEQLDFPHLYASGRQGWAVDELADEHATWRRCSTSMLRHVPPPAVDRTRPSACSATILDYDNYLGRVLTGRVEQGRARLNMPVRGLRDDGTVVETGAPDQADVLPRPRPGDGRGGRGRRHHRRRRADRGDRRRHHRRPRPRRAAARACPSIRRRWR